MSAIVGVCGTNFCTFVSDGRLVEFNGRGEVCKILSDEYRKIFKINGNLLLGVTGVLSIGENPLDVFSEYTSLDVLTMHMAERAIIKYLHAHKDKLSVRNYMLGGRDNKGKFCINEIQLNLQENSIDEICRMPDPPAHNFAVSCSIPPMADLPPSSLVHKHLVSTMPWASHDVLIKKMQDLVRDVSSHHETVGKHIYVENVF